MRFKAVLSGGEGRPENRSFWEGGGERRRRAVRHHWLFIMDLLKQNRPSFVCSLPLGTNISAKGGGDSGEMVLFLGINIGDQTE